MHRREKPGVLDQTLVAAYRDRTAAELAEQMIESRLRVRPKRHAIVDEAGARTLHDLLPPGIRKDASERIGRGDVLLVMRVDETAAYRVRSLMEEETNSVWTVATPPVAARRG